MVDTPGWLSDHPTTNRESEEILQGLALCESQPDVILLVRSAGSPFGPEQWGAMEAQLRRLHTPIWQRAMLLFTHGDCLGDIPIEEHIRQQSRTLQWLLERCGKRYHVLTNQPWTSESEVRELFMKMQRIIDTSRRPAEGFAHLRRGMSRRMERSGPDRTRDQIEMMPVCNAYDHPDAGNVYQQRQWRATAPAYLPRAFPSVQGVSHSALSLVLLGRRKSGKSTVGNLILNRRNFKTDIKTSRCSVEQGVVSGCSVTVVDTPGWSLFGLANPEQVKTEICRSPALCPVRSKVVFLLVVPVDSFKEKDRKAVETYVSVLGGNIWRSAVVLFTFGDELRGRTVERHVKDKGQALQWLMERCGHRHHVFNMTTGDATQVTQLLEKCNFM